MLKAFSVKLICLKPDNMSWAAYHASMQKPTDRLPAITPVMPIFKQKAAASEMIGHSMLLIQNATEHLNPEQTPINALVQPLYAIAKSTQWSNGHPFTEDNYMVIFGGGGCMPK